MTDTRAIPMKYGREDLALRVPQDALLVAPKSCTTPALSSAQLEGAFEHEGLIDALAGAGRIALVVNDQTRKGGMRVTLEAIARLLDRARVDRDRVTLVVAYGLHAPQSDDVSREIYGDAMLARTHLVHHDGRDPKGLLGIGALPSGAPLSIAREVAEADLRVLVGAVGFHYYAGFSGGRKAVLPGVADEASVVRNHLRVLDPEGPGGRAAGCGPARLDGNPVSDEMFAAARLVDAFHGRSFLANAIIGAAPGVSGQVIDVACGLDVEAAFRAGCARLVATNAVAIDTSSAPDAVVASAGGWPYDAALYQAHKAYDNAFRALAPRIARGERPPLIFLARCDEGLGHRRFAAWLDHPTREAHYQALTAGYEIVGQTSLAVRDKAALTRTIAVTDLDDDTCARLGWEKARSLDDAMARAGTVTRWGVIPSAGAVLPVAT
jgi:lactate racemase